MPRQPEETVHPVLRMRQETPLQIGGIILDPPSQEDIAVVQETIDALTTNPGLFTLQALKNDRRLEQVQPETRQAIRSDFPGYQESVTDRLRAAGVVARWITYQNKHGLHFANERFVPIPPYQPPPPTPSPPPAPAPQPTGFIAHGPRRLGVVQRKVEYELVPTSQPPTFDMRKLGSPAIHHGDLRPDELLAIRREVEALFAKQAKTEGRTVTEMSRGTMIGLVMDAYGIQHAKVAEVIAHKSYLAKTVGKSEDGKKYTFDPTRRRTHGKGGAGISQQSKPESDPTAANERLSGLANLVIDVLLNNTSKSERTLSPQAIAVTINEMLQSKVLTATDVNIVCRKLGDVVFMKTRKGGFIRIGIINDNARQKLANERDSVLEIFRPTK